MSTIYGNFLLLGGGINTRKCSVSCTVCPAFTIDLSKIPFTRV